MSSLIGTFNSIHNNSSSDGGVRPAGGRYHTDVNNNSRKRHSDDLGHPDVGADRAEDDEFVDRAVFSRGTNYQHLHLQTGFATRIQQEQEEHIRDAGLMGSSTTAASSFPFTFSASSEPPLTVERCVVVARHPTDGYGLTVSGQCPCRVSAVRPDGAAHRAGVRAGDEVLKVNGMPVSSSNYQEIVRMISGGQNVALTVRGPALRSGLSVMAADLSCGPFAEAEPMTCHPSVCGSGAVGECATVNRFFGAHPTTSGGNGRVAERNAEKEPTDPRRCQNNEDDDDATVDSHTHSYHNHYYHTHDQQYQRLMDVLQQEYGHLEELQRHAETASSSTNSSSSTTDESSSAQRRFAPDHQQRRFSDSERALDEHQHDAYAFGQQTQQRQQQQQQQQQQQCLRDNHRKRFVTDQWAGADYQLLRGSLESLPITFQGTSTFRSTKSGTSATGAPPSLSVVPNSASAFSASGAVSGVSLSASIGSVLNASARASTPGITTTVDGRRRHSREHHRSRAGSGAFVAVNRVDSLPVKSWVDSGGMHYVQSAGAAPMSLLGSVGVEPTDDGCATGDENGGGRHNEEDEDPEMEEATGPFANLLDLKTRSGHLAVFVSYVLNNSNPSSLLFYLITDAYQATLNTKELRRFAYEIFSTFLIPTAPLQLPNINQSLIQQIDKVLRAASGATAAASSNAAAAAAAAASTSTATSAADVEQLKRLFIPARTRAVGDINERLTQFRRKRALGGGGVDMAQLAQCARADHAAELKIAEQVLFRHLEALLVAQSAAAANAANGSAELDAYDARTSALIASLATLIKVVLNLRTNHSAWEKLLEKCPTFITSAKSSSTLLAKMKPKKTIQLKDHQFTLNAIYLTVHCYQCRNVIWGINPQAYFCQYCDVVVHKQCTAQLADHCYPVVASQKSKSSSGSGTITGKSSKKSSSAQSGGAKTSPSTTQRQNASSNSLDYASSGAIKVGEDAFNNHHSSAIAFHQHYYSQHHAASQHHHHNSRGVGAGGGRRISDSVGNMSSVPGGATATSGNAGIARGAQASSASVTPPLTRSHASTATIVGSTIMSGSRPNLHNFDDAGGSSTMRRDTKNYVCGGIENDAYGEKYEEQVEEEEENDDDDEDDDGDQYENAPPPPPVPHAAVAAVSIASSPPSSGVSILPPPVFSQKFERIEAPQPPPPQSLQPRHHALAAAAAAEHVAAKSTSSDSGIGGELVPGAPTILRAHSMRVEPSTSAAGQASGGGSNSIRRNGRGANSLGAADSPTGPAISPLAVNAVNRGVTSDSPSAGSLLSIPSGKPMTPSASSVDLPHTTMSTSRISSASAHESTSTLAVAPECVRVSPTLNKRLSIDSGSGALAGATAISATATATTVPEDSESARKRLLQSVQALVIADNDSDLELETEAPPLESFVSADVLRRLKPKEKKRQEVVNELFHTERTHVRNLKILYKVFYRPMVVQGVAEPALLQLLFGNLTELLAVHQEMYGHMRGAMLRWKADAADAAAATTANASSEMDADGGGGGSAAAAGQAPYGDVGALIERIFDGKCGKKLMQETATFCQNQQHALDTLRQRYSRNKDDPFSAFLANAESSPLCRKLQLKDMIPVEMQRLVKYPLLIETIAKYTPDPSEELTRLLHGVNCAKRILSAVNTAKRNAENLRRLEEIQKRVDYSTGSVGGGNVSGMLTNFFQKFDFRNHRLIYEGSLQWRQPRGKTVDLHVVLLEHLLVFLTRVGADASSYRYQLRVHESGSLPIMRLGHVEVEEKVGDKRAFNLLYKCDLRLFELVAATATERKTWHRLIENQVVVSTQKLARCGTDPHFIDLLNPAASAALRRGSLAFAPGDSDPGHAESAAESATSITAAGTGGDTAKAAIAVSSTVVEPNGVARAEQVHVLTHPNLVTANEIVVEQPRVLEHAKSMLTPAERLRSHDKMIISALVDKHQILSDLLKEQKKGSEEELERIAEIMTGLSVPELKQKSSRELAMSAIVHGNRLLDSINKGMSLKMDENERDLPSVPCYKLTAVAAPLMNHLKALMQVVQDQDALISQLRSGDGVGSDATPVAGRSAGSGGGCSDLIAPSSVTVRKPDVLTLIGANTDAPPPQPPASAPPPLDD